MSELIFRVKSIKGLTIHVTCVGGGTHQEKRIYGVATGLDTALGLDAGYWAKYWYSLGKRRWLEAGDFTVVRGGI